MHTKFLWGICGKYIAELHPKIHRHFSWQSSARMSHPRAVTWLQLLRKHIHRSRLQNHNNYARMNSRTLPTCDISLDWSTLPTPEVGDFVELLLLYPISVLARPGWKTILDSLCNKMVCLGWASCFSAYRQVSFRSRGTKKKQHIF